MSRINAEKQLEQWIDQYQNLIYSICLQLTKDYFDAQDLTQETFLSAYKNLAYFDGRNAKAFRQKTESHRQSVSYHLLADTTAPGKGSYGQRPAPGSL